MNKIKNALSLMNIKPFFSENFINSEICLNEDFPAFNGHFPDNKILPGFVQIIISIFIIESFLKTKFSLKEIIQTKFKSPILPLEKFMININISELNENGLLLRELNRFPLRGLFGTNQQAGSVQWHSNQFNMPKVKHLEEIKENFLNAAVVISAKLDSDKVTKSILKIRLQQDN